MPNQQRSFGQPDPRTDTDRLEDLRKIQRQVTSILSARDDAAFEEQFFTDVRERRAGRTDRTQFELIPDKYGGTTLAAVTRGRDAERGRPGELLIHVDDLQDVRRLLSLHGLREEPIAELDRRVVRLRGGQLNPIELANLASESSATKSTDLRQLHDPNGRPRQKRCQSRKDIGRDASLARGQGRARRED